MRILTLSAILCLGLTARAEAFSPPAWSLNQPIYEVNLEMFSAQGGFKGLEARLPEIKKLGVGIVWLMPIHPRGDWSAYCVTDYKGINPAFGTADDLKSLVKSAHAQGLHLILDWVGNHSSWKHAWIKEHPEYYVKTKEGKISQAHEWTDVAQFDFKNKAMRAAMVDAMKYWVDTFDIDGFRCDVAWGVPIDFWVEARTALEAKKPLFMLSEGGGSGDQQAFDSHYAWDLMNSGKTNLMTDVYKGAQPALAISRLLKRERRVYRAPFQRMRFITNHDEWQDNGTTRERFGEGRKAFAVLAATLPGKPMIYNGQEIDWQQRKGAIEWKTSPMQLFYKTLFSAYQKNPALNAGLWRAVESSNPDHIIAYLRQSGTARVLVAINLSPNPAECLIEDAPLAGKWSELFSGKSETIEGLYSLKLAPWEYRVLSGESKSGPDADFSPGPELGARAEASCNSEWTPITKLAVGSASAATARFRTEYSARAFTVYVSVSKTALVHDSPDTTPWDDDAVEVFFDMKHDRNTPYAADDFQFIVGYKNSVLFEGQKRVDGVSFSTKDAPGGFLVRLEIPWKTLGFEPKAGLGFGFDVGVDIDADGGARDAALVWSGDDQNYHDTWQFGDLTLGQVCP